METTEERRFREARERYARGAEHLPQPDTQDSVRELLAQRVLYNNYAPPGAWATGPVTIRSSFDIEGSAYATIENLISSAASRIYREDDIQIPLSSIRQEVARVINIVMRRGTMSQGQDYSLQRDIGTHCLFKARYYWDAHVNRPVLQGVVVVRGPSAPLREYLYEWVSPREQTITSLENIFSSLISPVDSEELAEITAQRAGTYPEYVSEETEVTPIQQTLNQKQLWENQMHIEYAKDICAKAAIPWKEEYAAAVAPLQTRLDVNKYVFGDLAQRPKENANIPEELMRVLLARSPNGGIASKITYYTSQQQSMHTWFNDNKRLHDNKLHDLTTIRNELQRLVGLTDEETYADEMARINAAGLFKFNQVHGTTDFSLISVNDVVIHHKNISQNVDMRVNFGKVVAKVNLNISSITVSFPGMTTAMRVDGYSHPHVNTGGGVCWGNADAVYRKFAGEGKLHDALTALWLVLNNYNDGMGGPYVALHQFYVKQNPEALKDAERRVVKARHYWIAQSYLEGLLGDDVEQWQVQVIDTRTESDDDGDEIDYMYVMIWEKRIMPYNVRDEAAGYFVAGPRGGNPVHIDSDELRDF